jgi:predicted N-acetyltransferase YhbS
VKFVAALRAARQLTVSLVAELSGKVIGHVAISPVSISDGVPAKYFQAMPFIGPVPSGTVEYHQAFKVPE